jgi:uncharacterized protein YcbX
MADATVTGLWTYPVKSCAGIALREAQVTARGLALDRDFMLIDDDADFVSQRKVAQLALVVPLVAGRELVLSAPGMEEIRVPLELDPDDERTLRATVHGKEVFGQRVSGELDEWFTTFLPPYKESRGYRLLRVREDRPREVKERYRHDDASNVLGFADGNSMLLASERSLAQLNTLMDEAVPMNRFRPNIAVDGEGLEPFDEDRWVEVGIGELDAYVVKACDRCVIPDIEQSTAAVGKEVRRALRTRRGANAHDETNKGVFFAQNLNHVFRPGTVVRVGDPVEVRARAERPNVVLDAR